jgi:hypothetical protein
VSGSKEFCANPGNKPTNRKSVFAQLPFFKRF